MFAVNSRGRHKFTEPPSRTSSLSRRHHLTSFGKGGVSAGVALLAAIVRLLISTGDLEQRNRKFLTPTRTWAW